MHGTFAVLTADITNPIGFFNEELELKRLITSREANKDAAGAGLQRPTSQLSNQMA